MSKDTKCKPSPKKIDIAHKHVEVLIQGSYCFYPIKVIKNKHIPAGTDCF